MFSINCAFSFFWRPTTNAIMGLTFANYVLQPFFAEDCGVPVEAAQLLAGATICKWEDFNNFDHFFFNNFSPLYTFIGFLTFINCYDVKFTTKLQNIFMFTKIAALVIVIIVGIVWMAYGRCSRSIAFIWNKINKSPFVTLGHLENFERPFDNTETDPGKLSIAFYSGIFSYAGWYVVHFIVLSSINVHLILSLQELFEFYDWRASRAVQEFAACYLHIIAARDCHLCFSEYGLFGGPVATGNDCIQCHCCGKNIRHRKYCIRFTCDFFFSFVDVRQQIISVRCMGHPINGCNFSVWRFMRSHYGLVKNVFRWSPQRAYAIVTIAHKHPQIHSSAVACVSRELIAFNLGMTWNLIQF